MAWPGGSPKDGVQAYAVRLQLQKAALVEASNLEALKQTILPVRHSVFSYTEPTIWLYTEAPTGAQLFMAADHKDDVRIWFQPQTVLAGVHIVLDGLENNQGQQVVALQIIATNIMALLLDKAMDADIEIIDDQVGIIVRRAAKAEQQLRDALSLALQLHQLATSVTNVRSL